MKTQKAYVYNLNTTLKQAYFVAKFESVADADLCCQLMNDNLRQRTPENLLFNRYAFSTKPLEKSPYGYYIYKE